MGVGQRLLCDCGGHDRTGGFARRGPIHPRHGITIRLKRSAPGQSSGSFESMRGRDRRERRDRRLTGEVVSDSEELPEEGFQRHGLQNFKNLPSTEEKTDDHKNTWTPPPATHSCRHRQPHPPPPADLAHLPEQVTPKAHPRGHATRTHGQKAPTRHQHVGQ